MIFFLSLIVINEIMWAKAEYIELFNTSSDEVSLDGWYLTRQKSPVGGIDQEEETVLTFSTADTIPASGYFLIESSESATTVPSNKIKSSLGLVDAGVLLRLRSQDDTIVDTANQTGSWFAGENTDTGFSMERINASSDGTTAGAWQTSGGGGTIGGRFGTPSQENGSGPDPTPDPTVTPTPIITPTPTPDVVAYSNDVHINEFLPNPTGDDTSQEFIELHNSGSDEVDISHWVLDDITEGGSTPFVFPQGTSIPGKGFLAFYRTQTKLALNNDTDHVRLIRPDAVIQDDVSYTNTIEGHSYNRKDAGAYVQSSTITPNAANVITSPTTKASVTTDDKEEEKEGDVVYDFSTKIFINEFLPNPVGADSEMEFIEIKSQDTKTIRLFGWTLDDEEGGSKPYRFTKEDIIAPGQILVFFRSKTKIALNNDEDSVRLIDPNGKVISSVSYEEKVAEGQSFNRTPEGVFEWSETLTPGKENVVSLEEKSTPSIKPKAVKKASVVRAAPTSRVLAASVAATTLPWTEYSQEEGVISHSVVASQDASKLPRGKQGFFLLLGVCAASWQLVGGISHKEKIWHRN